LTGRLGQRLAYRVTHVRNADARFHRRVAEDGWRAGEVVEESNSGAKKNRRDVDVDFIEEASKPLTLRALVQRLLGGPCTELNDRNRRGHYHDPE